MVWEKLICSYTQITAYFKTKIILMQYLNESIQTSFMIDTKFASNRFFGLIKKKYRHTFVSTIDEMHEVVRNKYVVEISLM